jgi:hypothetical protein
VRYVYSGSDPQEDPGGGIVHPGDVRDFDAEPDWGAWSAIPGDMDAPAASETVADTPPLSPAAGTVPAAPAVAPDPVQAPFTPVPEGS